MIIGITGRAGAGKDTIADVLVKSHGFVKVGLADEIKRICKRVFDFSDDQLWGPSAMRNAPDPRYHMGGRTIRPKLLTPREALQQLGTQWGRAMYENVWVDLALRAAAEVQAGHEYYQTRGTTVEKGPAHSVVIPDVRFLNEITAIKKAGGVVIRVVRPPVDSSAQAIADVLWRGHESETEQDAFPAELIDTTYVNSGTLDDVDREIGEWMAGYQSKDVQKGTP